MIEHFEAKQIDVVGFNGVTERCIQAILRYVHFGDRVESARVLSDNQNRHAFVLFLGESHWVIIRSGFNSGYNGEGSAGLAFILLLLKSFNIDTSEIKVSDKIVNKLNDSRVYDKDVQNIIEKNGGYLNLDEYINGSRIRNLKPDQTWSRFPVTIPYKLIDGRIRDLVKDFYINPDASLNAGFRRLEELLKSRTKSDLFGVKLCEHAFSGDRSKLTWSVDAYEKLARVNYFKSTFAFYRNRRAHKEILPDEIFDMNELFALNSLFILESEAIPNE